METADDNDNQGSSTGAEIRADDIGNENSPCNSTMGETVAIVTADPNKSPLNKTISRSDSPVPVLDAKIDNDTNSQSSQATYCVDEHNQQSGDENSKRDSEVTGLIVSETNDDGKTLLTELNEDMKDEDNHEDGTDNEQIDDDKESGSGVKSSDENAGVSCEEELNDDISTSKAHDASVDMETSQKTQCNENLKDKTLDDDEVNYFVKVTQIQDESMSPSVDFTNEDNVTIENTPQQSNRSTPQFTSVVSEDSCDDSNSQEPPTVSYKGFQTLPSPHVMQHYVKLDEETCKDWFETRRKMGFESDVDMARFLLKRASTYSTSESSPVSQDGEASQKETKQCADLPKKKATTSLGGIESIVRRLHQVRTETGESTSQPGSDTESQIGTELLKIKKEPEETTCNTDVASTSISKEATTAMYSSKRNGRKRVFVKREPVDFDEEYGQDTDDSTWPVHIKQEPDDLSETTRTLGDFVMSAASWVSNLVASELGKEPVKEPTPPPADANSPESLFSEKSLHKIIEAQLSKPNEPSLSEKRLHSVIEEQLDKPMSVTQIKVEPGLSPPLSKAEKKEMKKARREARHAKKLKKAIKKERDREQEFQRSSPFDRPLSGVSSNSSLDNSGNPFAKSISPFDKSPSSGPETNLASQCLESFARMVQFRDFTGSSSLENHTPSSFPNSPAQQPAQFPEIAGNPPVSMGLLTHTPSNQRGSNPGPIQPATAGSPPVPTGLLSHALPSLTAPVPTSAGNPPVPTGLYSHAHVPSSTSDFSSGFSPQPQRSSPAPDGGDPATPEHPASLFLKSIAQRTSKPPVPEPTKICESSSRPVEVPSIDQRIDPKSSDTPLEQLLKVSEAPQQQHTSAKSQLESLLKAKDIKDKWSKPSPQLSQQIPHQVSQIHTMSPSAHILKVPKVTFSGRKINESSHESFVKAGAIDRLLAASGVSSDSEDSGREERDLEIDPEWNPGKKRGSRKRQTDSDFYQATSQTPGNVMNVAGEPNMKYQKLSSANQNPLVNGNKSTELSASNTLAKLLQMANNNQTQTPAKALQPTTSPANVVNASPTPKPDFSAKQSAFGAMQAFAQLVEIQGKTPTTTPTKPEQKPSQPKKLSDSLPSITRPSRDSSPAQPPQGQTKRNTYGTRHKYDYGMSSPTVMNGSPMSDLDGPQDLSMHSKIKIKLEPLDTDDCISDTRTSNQGVNYLDKHLHFTCSLCCREFPSITEVTDHKLRDHYSSNFESFEMVT